jgi:hypothetical protein
MTRETKVGLIVASSFLSLVGVVVAARMSRPPDQPQRTTEAPKIAQADPEKDKGPAKNDTTPASAAKPAEKKAAAESAAPAKVVREAQPAEVTPASLVTPAKLPLFGSEAAAPQLPMASAAVVEKAAPAVPKAENEPALANANSKPSLKGPIVDKKQPTIEEQLKKQMEQAKAAAGPGTGAIAMGATNAAILAAAQNKVTEPAVSVPPVLPVAQTPSNPASAPTSDLAQAGQKTPVAGAKSGAAQAVDGGLRVQPEQATKLAMNQTGNAQPGAAQGSTVTIPNAAAGNTSAAPVPVFPAPTDTKPQATGSAPPTTDIKPPPPVKTPTNEPQLAGNTANAGTTSVPPQPPAPIGGKPEAVVAPIPVPSGGTGGAGLVQVKDWSVENYDTQAGDRSFEDISKKKYNNEQYGRALLAYNRSHNPQAPTSIFKDPPQLQPGQKIAIPPLDVLQSLDQSGMSSTPTANNSSPVSVGVPRPVISTPGIPDNAASPPPGAATASSAPLDGKSYRVPDGGEHIYAIARDKLGDGSRWSEIWRLNPGVNPGMVAGGTVLRLP